MSGCRMNGDMPAIVTATEVAPRAQAMGVDEVGNWSYVRESAIAPLLWDRPATSGVASSSLPMSFNPSSAVGASALRTMGRGGGRTGLSMLGWVKNAMDLNRPPATCEVVSPIFQEVRICRRHCCDRDRLC